MYRYFTTQRPPMIGCVPNGMKAVVDFAEKVFVNSIGREAWGYVLYDKKLTEQQIADYELTEDPNNSSEKNEALHQAKMYARDILDWWAKGIVRGGDDLAKFCHQNGIGCIIAEEQKLIVIENEVLTLTTSFFLT